MRCGSRSSLRHTPSKLTVPESGRSMPLMRFSSVDLPEPLRPMMTVWLAAAMLMLTRSSTQRRCSPAPKLRLTQSRVNTRH